ncbi:metal-dependent hydrolase [Candidatus Woesearchaeota archaeon]|nr:metal-dependent hydrolase [Candidatus Woesearchaeota archaeon]
MMFRTHLVFAFLFGLIINSFFSVGNVYLFMIFVLFAAGLPDIDHPGSKYGRKLGIISKAINFVLGHRGIFHSLFFALLLSVIVWYFNQTIGYGIFAGYLSHLIGDGLSKEGINLLYPFTKLEIKGFLRVGGIVENILFIFLLGLSFYVVIF